MGLKHVMRRQFLRGARGGPLVALGLGLACLNQSARAAPSLEAGFTSPPAAARPWIWWHWTNRNVTRAAITADLESMAAVGMGGVQIFDVDVGNPTLVEEPVDFMSPRWLQMVAFAAAECQRLGMGMSVHSSAGWSESGGPWVSPSDGMQKLVWSETAVEGPTSIDLSLPEPPSMDGPYQNLSRARMGTPRERWPADEPHHYRDVAVLAFPLLPREATPGDNKALLTSAAPGFNAGLVTDGDPNTRVKLTFTDADAALSVDIVYPRPRRVQSLTLALGWTPPAGEFQVATGATWTRVAQLPGPSIGSRPVPKTISFPAVTADRFRIVFRPRPPRLSFELAEIALGSAPRIHRFEDKAAFTLLPDNACEATPPVERSDAIDPATVIDLTGTFPDGHGRWQVPPGRWTILRFGHSGTGMKTRPANPAGLGLEVDKLNAAAVSRYAAGLLDPIRAAVQAVGAGPPWRSVVMDSWEAEHQNWTPSLLAQFRKRRAYDPTPYLPAMSGRIVGSAEISDRFLWDFRRTIADLVADNHYGVFAAEAHARGLALEGEAVGQGMPMVADQLQTRGRMDIPMGEFWVAPAGPRLRAKADCKEASSAAHIYGKPIVAAEAFSSGPDIPAFSLSPRDLKAIGDIHLAAGINRMSLHQYTLQPFNDRKPGFTLGEWGTHFGRHNTWWRQSGAWLSYLARAQFVLQQGTFVGDVLYFYGEGAPATVPDVLEPPLPAGHDFDVINAEGLLAHAKVDADGTIRLPGGGGYRVLVLPAHGCCSPRVLGKIESLVAGGATVLGPRPAQALGLTGWPDSDRQVKALARALWGECDGTGPCRHRHGRGLVVVNETLEQIFAQQRLEADVSFAGPDGDADLAFLHRLVGGRDVYFIANLAARARQVNATFRVTGKTPSLWLPETAAIRRGIPFNRKGRATSVALDLGSQESVFVVWDHSRPSIEAQVVTAARPIDGPWHVAFVPAGSAPVPAPRTLDSLVSWSESSDPDLRYFSGTAVYRTTFTWAGAPPGTSVELDLGQVHEIADVIVNDTLVGTVWNLSAIDVSKALRPGVNRLELRVTNLWTNRLIGDAALPAAERSTWTTHHRYTTSSPLRPAGLLGPVRLQTRGL